MRFHEIPAFTAAKLVVCSACCSLVVDDDEGANRRAHEHFHGQANIHIDQAQIYTPKAGDVIVIETTMPVAADRMDQLLRHAKAIFGHEVEIAVLGGAKLGGVVRKEPHEPDNPQGVWCCDEHRLQYQKVER